MQVGLGAFGQRFGMILQILLAHHLNINGVVLGHSHGIIVERARRILILGEGGRECVREFTVEGRER